MHVAMLVLELRLHDCSTLRQRRQRVAAIVGKLRQHFNVSLVELSRENSSEAVSLAVATVARTRREARDHLERVADAVASYPLADLITRPLIRDR